MAGLDPPVARLLERGVVIPRPELVVIDPAVDPTRIEAAAEILPGSRVEGSRTLVGRGSRIGTAGPAVLRNCAVGRGVDLGSGVFEDCVFLDGSSFGPGAQARGGTLFEERSRAAHTVGSKHTILLPFVTLGSLINFCDCMMAGGRGEADHGEVGSGFIHFNFTPAGDKATPSLFGGIPRGVFLREPKIFLGGNAGAVGPIRVGFGTVLAAGSVYRRDYGERMLVLGEAPRAESRPLEEGRISGVREKVRKNLEYLAEMTALLGFHGLVRARLAGTDPHRSALAAASVTSIEDSIAERLRQLERFGAILKEARTGGRDDAEYQRAFCDRFAAVRPNLSARDLARSAGHPGLDRLLRTIPKGGGEYLEWVRRLTDDEVAAGVEWLESVRESFLAAAGALLRTPATAE
jgi:hypothetical protein